MKTNKNITNNYGFYERIRPASHAGSWYSDNPVELDRQLSDWLSKVDTPFNYARAIISPHAGYTYCGDTAAHAYKQISPDKVKRFFVLGPSHVVYLSGCALTTCSKYSTPLGDLCVDKEINDELMSNNEVTFELMALNKEESEHCIEMQMPFIAKIMKNSSSINFKIIPVLVGSLSVERQVAFGKVFAKYLSDPSNFFVISSDFCHWGNRFHYVPLDSSNCRNISEQIARLDQKGMNAISSLNPSLFNDYLKETQNTICGRNPICLFLQAVKHFRTQNDFSVELRFLKYSQSNKCRTVNDSSVSYAAGALYILPKL